MKKRVAGYPFFLPHCLHQPCFFNLVLTGKRTLLSPVI